MKPKAVVLLSGGLDSAVTLFIARREGYDCRCITFDYGQRHTKEIACARRIAAAAGATMRVAKLPFPWKGSSLIGRQAKLPLDRTVGDIKRKGIPSTYVPGRNTVFLSLAASYAEVLGADRIYIGAHFEDSSGYPDCRKEYLDAFNEVLHLGTKRGSEGKLTLRFPLIDKAKKDIITLGTSLGVPFAHTWSCYKGGLRPCGRCDSCVLRSAGFRDAGIDDPALE